MKQPTLRVHRLSPLLGPALVAALACQPGDGETTTTTSATTSASTSTSTSTSATAGPTGDVSGDPSTGADSTGSAACDGLVGEGFAVGQIAENWVLQDQSGAPVNLHDYCGQVIYIELGAEW